MIKLLRKIFRIRWTKKEILKELQREVLVAPNTFETVLEVILSKSIYTGDKEIDKALNTLDGYFKYTCNPESY